MLRVATRTRVITLCLALVVLTLSATRLQATAALSRIAALAGQQATVPDVFVPYDPAKAVAYANVYTTPPNQYTNSDDCYINTNTCGIITDVESDRASRDGAHFVGCVLNAAGVPSISRPLAGLESMPTCARDSDGRSLRSANMTPIDALPAGWYKVSFAEAKPGNLIAFVHASSQVICWSGVVIARDPATNEIVYAAHSRSTNNGRLGENKSAKCPDEEVANPIYLAINSDIAPPQVMAINALADYPPRAVGITWSASDAESGLGGARLSQPPAGRWGGGYQLQAWDGATWVDLGTPMLFTEPPVGDQVARFDLSTLVGMCETIPVQLVVRDNVGNQTITDPITVGVLQEGDLTRDGAVDQQDLAALAAQSGAALTADNAHFDLTGDGQITSADRLWLLQLQGARCNVSAP